MMKERGARTVATVDMLKGRLSPPLAPCLGHNALVLLVCLFCLAHDLVSRLVQCACSLV